jgi:retinol dehydrogenase 12
MVTHPVSHGAITPLYAGTAPEAGELNGKVSIPVSSFARVNGTSFQYLTVWARETLPHKKALDTHLGKTLWKWCEDQVTDI